MGRYRVCDAYGRIVSEPCDYPAAVRTAVAIGPGTRVHDHCGVLLWPLAARSPSTPAPVDPTADTEPPPEPEDACLE